MQARTYMPPEDAHSPHIPTNPNGQLLQKLVVYNGGEGRYSYALVLWRNVWGDWWQMGFRWLGTPDNYVGFPNLRGNGGWIVLPRPMGLFVVAWCQAQAAAGDAGIRPVL
jgi:hypothetical protein